MPEMVKLRVKYKPTQDMPASESVWGEPLELDQSGGTFRLQNSSLLVPLAAGDVVRAEQAGDGELQVTDTVQASASILTVGAAPPGADLDLNPTIEKWSGEGALWTEGRGGLLVTVWSQDMRLEAIESVIRPTLSEGLIWHASVFPATRVAANMPEVDFQLQQVVIEPVEDDEDE